MFKSDSLAKLAPALVKAQKNMGAALKDAKNPFFKSRYADLNAIIDAAIPALNDEGIAVLQSPDVTETGTSVINTILLHESGEFIAGRSKVVASKQNDAQAEGSATTYARRYGLQAMVTLKAEDDDGEAAVGRSTGTSKEFKSGTTVNAKATEVKSSGEIKTSSLPKEVIAEVVTTSEVAAPKKGGWSSRAKKTESKGDLY